MRDIMICNHSKNETKEERFERLAKKRMDELKKTFKLLSNLANTNNYKYSEKQIDQMVREIKRCTDELEFNYGKKNKNVLETSFTFKP